MMRILITGAGGAAAISVWKSLHPDHTLYMADIDPCATGLYLVPESHRHIILRGDAPNFVENILQICCSQKIDVLIPTVDHELAPLAASIDKFLASNIKVPISPVPTLELCRDKYQLLTRLHNIVPVPQFALLNSETLPTFNAFPLFAKPRCGSGSQGALTLYSREMLLALPCDNTYLVQELLPGNEYSVDVYIHSDGTPIAAVPRLRMKVDSGIAVAARTEHIPALMDQAIKTAQHTQIRYVANIQFKQASDGDYKLLEINPRFPGTLPLTAEAGIDIPQLLINDIQGKPFSKGLMPFKDLMVVRYWAEHFCSLSEWENLCRQKNSG